jgi:glutamate/tyrosine decarboxylase-like PLP-dependent enzyme
VDEILQIAADRAIEHLSRLDEPPVAPVDPEEALRAALDVDLPDRGVDAAQVVADLADGVSPGLVKSAGGRYFGFVTGGGLPAALAADWLTSAWDQNAFSYVASPAAAVVEDVAARWLLEVLDLPRSAAVAFVTGCQMAHVTAMAAARHHLLERAGWDVGLDGLAGAPVVRVVAGAHRHATVDRALRLLGLGTRVIDVVPSDEHGRMSIVGAREALERVRGHPALLVLQAGEVNTGSFDAFEALVAMGREVGAWVHVDGAFGLWARAARTLTHLTAGVEDADSWAFDAHKWLNVPYDSGVAVVAHRDPLRAAMRYAADYLAESSDRRDASDWTPDASRRARGIPVYAALRSLGREGVSDLVTRCCDHARAVAAGLESLGFEIVNEVALNQVLVRARSDAETEQVLRRVQESGETWMGGTVWDGRSAIRISVSSWATSATDIERTIAAFAAALDDAE